MHRENKIVILTLKSSIHKGFFVVFFLSFFLHPLATALVYIAISFLINFNYFIMYLSGVSKFFIIGGTF